MDGPETFWLLTPQVRGEDLRLVEFGSCSCSGRPWSPISLRLPSVTVALAANMHGYTPSSPPFPPPSPLDSAKHLFEFSPCVQEVRQMGKAVGREGKSILKLPVQSVMGILLLSSFRSSRFLIYLSYRLSTVPKSCIGPSEGPLSHPCSVHPASSLSSLLPAARRPARCQ
jgi:hypothetical protein